MKSVHREPPALTPPAPPNPYRWAMLFGLWLVYTCFGMAVYSTAPLVEPIAHDLGLSLGQMGAVMGAWPLIYIGMAIPAGALLDRIGVRRGLLAAAAIITLSLALRASANGFASLFLSVALFGVGGPLVSVGAPKLVASAFEGSSRGLAIGICTTGPTIGATTVLVLTHSVLMPLTGNSWRSTLLIYAAFVTLAGVVWFLISNRAPGRHYDPINPDGHSIRRQLDVFVALLRLTAVRIVLVLAIGIFVFNHSMNNWLPEILRTGGMTAAAAGVWASVPSLVGTVAALTLPRLATPSRRLGLLLVITLLAATATILIGYAEGPFLVLGLIFQGIARGAMIPLAMFVLMETRDVDARVMGAAGGLFYSSAEIGGTIGPTMTGILAEATGGFLVPLGTLTAVCLICTALVVTLDQHTKRQLVS